MKNDNPEGRLVRAILQYVNAIGGVIGKTKTMGVQRNDHFCFDRYLFRGFPDLTAFYKNKIYFIEAKSETGVQSPEQIKFQELCSSSGITYILARKLEDVMEKIK